MLARTARGSNGESARSARHAPSAVDGQHLARHVGRRGQEDQGVLDVLRFGHQARRFGACEPPKQAGHDEEVEQRLDARQTDSVVPIARRNEGIGRHRQQFPRDPGALIYGANSEWVMGFADMLILLGIPYQSEKAATLGEEIMSRIQRSAVAASGELAARRGSFPAFHQSVFPARGVKRRRNATLTTVAPTGTISLLAGASSSVEPVLAFEVQRRIGDEVFMDAHPIYARYRQEGRPIDPGIFQTAWDISPSWHLKIQAAFQKYTDNAVSKTVNLPERITEEQVRDLFLQAADMNLKGITVYRDKSLPDQILSACSLKNEECS